MSIKTIIGPSPWQLLRDYLQMLLGTAIYTLGYTTFLLPYKIVSGGVSGISTIIYYLTGFGAGNTYFIINVFLLLMAMRILGWRYLFRTIIVTMLISAAIGLMQPQLTELSADGTPTLIHIVGEQKFMACVIGKTPSAKGIRVVDQAVAFRILTDGEDQLVFIDTPGLLKPRNELGEYMLGVKKMSAEEVAKVVHD